MTHPAIAVWNIRGFNNPDKVFCCKNLIRDHNLDILCLLENRISHHNLSDPWFNMTHTVFDNENSYNNFQLSSSGRIWIKWNSGNITFKHVFSSDQMITGTIVYGTQPPFLLSVIYASNTFEGRSLLWDDIRKVDPGNNLPWVVMGDFNCCRFQNEKIGGTQIAASRLAPFNSLVFDVNLTDVPSSGNFFTWYNQRLDQPIYSKLDRILSNDKWFDVFPSSSYNVLNSLISDHCPLILKTNIERRNNQRFMYKNYWSKNPEFWESLISVFALPSVGNPIISLYDKLHQLKVIIKGKNWNSFNSIKLKCDELSSQQLKIQMMPTHDLISPHQFSLLIADMIYLFLFSLQ
ncbi:hypothetical protein M5K25_005494 [Dendrobium thyrsiflorum]|uniref:Endonuclease/exonuclease/phosphatase domain-containing protein n=1 Tax=Dendrobium thyrsiflorum TaxID=117978 RepID=A0ABD0VI00_DENTH